MSRWPYNTSAWQRLRQAKLSAKPICEVCERRGRTALADAVDHVVAIAKGGDPFPPLAGLMSLCASCHNSKTARMDRGNSKGASRFKGCDVDGNPLDDEDGWYAAPAPARPHPAGFAGPESELTGTLGESQRYLLMLQNNKTESGQWV